MEMIRDALSPERLAQARKMLDQLTQREMVPVGASEPRREKRDFEEEADRKEWEKRRQANRSAQRERV